MLAWLLKMREGDGRAYKTWRKRRGQRVYMGLGSGETSESGREYTDLGRNGRDAAAREHLITRREKGWMY